MNRSLTTPLIDPTWDRAAWVLVAVHVVLLLAHWPLLPFFLDLYYHLNVLNGFREAGGVVLHEVWEFAPEGRPHLYPPVLHLALLSMDWLHVSPITLARLAAVTPYPALLMVTWWCMREWLGSRTAYWTTVCSLAPFSYLLMTCNTIAASWALVLWLLGLIALNRRAFLAFVCSSLLVFYTHLGIPWLMLGSWLLLGWGHKPWRDFLRVGAATTLVFSLPWLIHLGVHAGSFGPMSSMENASLELPILVDLLAGVGSVLVLRMPKGPARSVLLSVGVSFLPLLVHYRYRFFSGQGLLGVAVLAGPAFTWVQHRLEATWCHQARKLPWLIPGAMTALVFLGNPTMLVQDRDVSLRVGESSLLSLIVGHERFRAAQASSFYAPQLIEPVVRLIREHTRPDEIIGCNLPYTCGLFAALSNRAMATGMFAEVRGASRSSAAALRQAHLIVWLKVPPLPGMPPLHELQQAWRLRLVGETDIAYLLRNAQAQARKRPARPILPLWLAQGVVWSLVGCLIVDLYRHRANVATGVQRWQS